MYCNASLIRDRIKGLKQRRIDAFCGGAAVHKGYKSILCTATRVLQLVYCYWCSTAAKHMKVASRSTLAAVHEILLYFNIPKAQLPSDAYALPQ